MDVPVSKALAGCMVAAGVVGLLAVVRVLSVVLGIVPDSIKLAVVSPHVSKRETGLSCCEITGNIALQAVECLAPTPAQHSAL
jgi:hypothetical protein